jgi:hypothetical protein
MIRVEGARERRLTHVALEVEASFLRELLVQWFLAAEETHLRHL